MTPPVTSITFTDSIGAAVLKNGKPYPANRFDGWTPVPLQGGDIKHRQSDFTPSAFITADVFAASFKLSKIPIRTTDSVRYVAIARRLIRHLKRAGSCTITTGDTDSNVYSSCYLMPGTEPTLEPTDPNQLEYTLSLALFSPGGDVMDCNYDP